MASYPMVGESIVARLQSQLDDILSVSDVKVSEGPERSVSFTGHLLREPDEAYSTLRERFQALGYTPFLRKQGEYQVVIARQGVILPRSLQVWVNVALFIATLLATLLTGALNEIAPIMPAADQIVRMMLRQPALLLTGLPFALTLMSILLAHEMGHYIVGRRYNAPVSLPYFIPMPAIGFGTMGAVIVQRAPFEDRRSLFDIGIAGPLAGLVVALPLLVYGLATSPVGPLPPHGLLEGNSILYLAIKYLVFGRVLPGNGMDVSLNAVAWAAWAGLLVTMLNLLPIGQLDGGHILYSLLGRRAWPVAMAIVVLLVAMGFLWQGWFLWAFLALLFGVRHPAPLNDLSQIGSRRTRAGIGMLVLFVLIFAPIPLSAF